MEGGDVEEEDEDAEEGGGVAPESRTVASEQPWTEAEYVATVSDEAGSGAGGAVAGQQKGSS